MVGWFEEEREITPELLSELTSTLRDRSREVIDIILNLINVRKSIREFMINKGVLKNVPNELNKDVIGYAIDSSFAQVLPLVVGDFFVVTAGYLRYPRHHNAGKEVNAGLKVGIRIFNETSPSLRMVSAYAHIIERKIAIELLRKGYEFNAFLIDGPILPLYLLFIPEHRYYDEEKKLIEITEHLITLSNEKEVSLIGIVKRVRSRFLINAFKDEIEKLLHEDFKRIFGSSNDKALGSLILNKGEAIFLGKPISDNPIYHALVSEIGFQALAGEFIESHEWFKEMEFAILKPKRSRQIVSVEAIDYANIGFENIISWINNTATHTGCPQILDYVDRYVQITSGLIEIARRLLIKIISERIREERILGEYEIIDLLLDYADLQKKYTPRMG